MDDHPGPTQQEPPRKADQAAENGRSAGARLRAAREAAGMSLEEVAQSLHLDKATVVALENDDHAHLPEPVFVKGYVRHYANLLGLDPDEVMPKAPAATTRAPSRPQATPRDVRWPPNSGGIRPFPLLIGSLLLILVGLSAWWLTRPKPLEIPPAALQQTQAAGPGASLATPASAATAVRGDQTFAPSTPSAVAAAPTLPATALSASAAAPAASVAAPAATATAPAVAPAAGVSSPPSQPGPAAAVPAASAQAAAARPPRAATLSLSLSGRSWIRISDASGKVLMLGLYGPGTQRELSGTPPYSVLLGNAPVVEVRLGGKRVDITPYIQANHTARFVLMADGATRP